MEASAAAGETPQIENPAGPPLGSPLALEVRDIHKTFRIPEHRVNSIKERVLHPLRRPAYRDLTALRGISFDVRKGEFFGIAGRNGSGKSTLLKVLASIYSADSGRLFMDGRLAPFIELGVGFSPELSGRENVLLNAVMMGLTPRQARARLPAVFEFAELGEFKEMKLKNYSSGMVVRLAFSVMLQADAEIMLIDEVLAVGDAAFQRKCGEIFSAMRDSDKTVVLVTHDMGAIQNYCHRAMLIDDGRLVHLGDPDAVASQYYRINRTHTATEGGVEVTGDVHARVVEAELLDAGGETVSKIAEGTPIRARAVIEATDELNKPGFGIHCFDARANHVFGAREQLDLADGAPARLRQGERIEIETEIKHRLVPGAYLLSCWVSRDRDDGERVLQALGLFRFDVAGADDEQRYGVTSVDARISFNRDPDGGTE